MGRFHSRADVGKNRLYVVLEGFFQVDEAKMAADVTIAEAKKLKPGFEVINDISTAKAVSEPGSLELLRCLVFLKERGVGRVVRVVPGVSVGSLQIARLARQAGYQADVAGSIPDAEAMLDHRESQ